MMAKGNATTGVAKNATLTDADSDKEPNTPTEKDDSEEETKEPTN